MTFTMSISATRPSYPRKYLVNMMCLQKSRPAVFRPQLSMGLALAIIKKASKKVLYPWKLYVNGLNFITHDPLSRFKEPDL